jgi:hypothetical protein
MESIIMTEFVKFNVRGRIFISTKENIFKYPDSLLVKLIETNERGDFKVDKIDDAIFIDRDDKYFNDILNIYRDGTAPYMESIKKNPLLINELKYYGLLTDTYKNVYMSGKYNLHYTSSNYNIEYILERTDGLADEIKNSKMDKLYIMPSLTNIFHNGVLNYNSKMWYHSSCFNVIVDNRHDPKHVYATLFSVDSLYKYYPFLIKLNLNNIFTSSYKLENTTIYYIPFIRYPVKDCEKHVPPINLYLGSKIAKLLIQYPERADLYIS